MHERPKAVAIVRSMAESSIMDLSYRNGEVDDCVATTKGLAEAVSLVRSLLEQITANDAPVGNETLDVIIKQAVSPADKMDEIPKVSSSLDTEGTELFSTVNYPSSQHPTNDDCRGNCSRQSAPIPTLVRR